MVGGAGLVGVARCMASTVSKVKGAYWSKVVLGAESTVRLKVVVRCMVTWLVR